MDLIEQKKAPLFFGAPWLPIDSWIEMIVPSLSALLSLSVAQLLGNLSPSIRSLLIYNLL